MTDSITVQRRFQGPPNSGNGGYVCGCLAGHIKGSATVRLRIPPPLETELHIRHAEKGVELLHGNQVVAEGRPNQLALETPLPPAFPEAVAASQSYRGFQSHVFPDCFVCGPGRKTGDGLRLFPGPVPGRSLVASPWVPDVSLADSRANVRPEFLWAALDCPGAFAFEWPQGCVVLLGELTASIEGAVQVGKEYVVIGWEIEKKERRHESGTAIFDASGVCLGKARATWFEVQADV